MRQDPPFSSTSISDLRSEKSLDIQLIQLYTGDTLGTVGGLFTHGGNRVSSSAGYRKEVMGTIIDNERSRGGQLKKRGDYNEMAL